MSPMHPTDRLKGSARGSAATAIAFAEARGAARLDDVRAYVKTVYELAPRVGLDPAIMIAQSVHETTEDGAPWNSFWWRQRLNPVGLGITGHPADDDASRIWTNGRDAAISHLAHLYLYAVGDLTGAPAPLSPDVDPRHDAFLAAFTPGFARSIADLTGTWAADPGYADKIAARGNVIFPNLGGTMELNMTKGLIPLPPIIDHIVDVSQRCQGPNDKRGFDFLGKRTIRGVVLHRSQGTFSSNINHFDSFCPGALTDLQVDDRDGRMMRFVRLAPPGQSADAPSGWANGVVFRDTNGYGDGRAFIELWGPRTELGVNVVNRDLESCEITGFFRQPNETTREDPVSEACWATLAQWIASRAHDYGIAWVDFPSIAAENGRSFVIWHQEFTLPERSLETTRKVCPGRTVINGTDALFARTREIMKRHQTGQALPPPDFVRFPQVRVFHAQQGAIGRGGPSRDFVEVRQLEPGEAISCDGFSRGQLVPEFGDDRWLRAPNPQPLFVHTSGVVEPI